MADADAVVQHMVLSNRRGLHARAAAKFVTVVDGFNADVKVVKDGQTVGGSSIMGLLMLGVPCGGSLCVEATGAEASEAVAALDALIADRFGEEE